MVLREIDFTKLNHSIWRNLDIPNMGEMSLASNCHMY